MMENSGSQDQYGHLMVDLIQLLLINLNLCKSNKYYK